MSTRLSIAFGEDLPEPHPPRYLLQARKDFYLSPQVTSNPIYSQLTETLQYAVAAPNRLFYNERYRMNSELSTAFNAPKGMAAASFTTKCELLSLQHGRHQEMDVDIFDSTLRNTSERYWETLPKASSDLICVPGMNSAQNTGINISLLLMAFITTCLTNHL